MLSYLKKYRQSLLLIGIGITFLFTFYGKILLNPNTYLFSESGDGIVHYYTYSWYIKNNPGYIEFQGMNYPYGEHINYSVGHPVVAGLYKSMVEVFPGLAEYSIGFLNFILIFQLLLAMLIMHLLLNALNVKDWINLIGSFSIIVCAPQIFRLTGHLSLGWTIAIPLTLLLLIKIQKNGISWKNIALLTITNSAWFFIHPYLGLMTIAICFFFFLGQFIISFKEKIRDYKNYLTIVLISFVPVGLFALFNTLTDDHTGRTDNPSGFFLYNAEPDDVFLPHHPPLSPLFNEITPIKHEWEGLGYIGFPAVIFCLVMIWLLSRKKIKRNKINLDAQSKSFLIPLLISAIILLLFSFGIPFRQFPVLLDWFESIKLVRATGRFTWPFYFAINIAMFYLLNRYYINSDSNWKKIALPLMIGLIMVFEGLPYHFEVSEKISQRKNSFHPDLIPDNIKELSANIDFDQYQAIIPIPYYFYGSEAYMRPGTSESLVFSLLTSYHYNIPIMTGSLARVSVPESKNLVQLMSPSWYPKAIKDDLSGDKPYFFLVKGKVQSNYEEMMLSKGSLIYSEDDVLILEVSYEDLFQSDAAKVIADFEQVKSSLYRKSGFLLTDSTGYLYYNSFEDQFGKSTFRGKGAYQGDKKGENILAEFSPGTFERNKTYHLSVWMNNSFKDALNLWFRLLVDEHDNQGELVKRTTVLPEQAEVIYDDWSLIEMEFAVEDPDNKIEVKTIGKENSNAPFVADDLLIRESNDTIYRIEEERNGKLENLFMNNHEIKSR